MAWTEPLTAATRRSPLDTRLRVVTVRDGTNLAVARVVYTINVNAALGEVVYLNRTGTVRQMVRAFGLMIRECIRGARSEGVVHFIADVRPKMAKAARLVSGLEGIRLVDISSQSVSNVAGTLADLEARVLART